MRKTSVPTKPYSKRIVRKFLIFPMTITFKSIDNEFYEEYVSKKETRWFEWASWEETFFMNQNGLFGGYWERTSVFLDDTKLHA